MENGDCLDRCGEVATASAVITQNTPVLEARNGVLDAGSAATMATPGSIAHDAAAAKHRCDELGDAAITAIGQDAAMLPAQHLDRRATVMDGIVAVTRPACRGGDDLEIAPLDEDLRVARPPVVLRGCGSAMVTRRDERAIDHP